MRKDYKKKVHLMSQSAPVSFCGRYLPSFPGMAQTFKIEEVTCAHCLKQKKEFKMKNQIDRNEIKIQPGPQGRGFVVEILVHWKSGALTHLHPPGLFPTRIQAQEAVKHCEIHVLPNLPEILSDLGIDVDDPNENAAAMIQVKERGKDPNPSLH